MKFLMMNKKYFFKTTHVNFLNNFNSSTPRNSCHFCSTTERVGGLSWVPTNGKSWKEKNRVCIPSNWLLGLKLLYNMYCSEKISKWLFAHLAHMKCIRLSSVRSSHLPFKMHYVRSSLHVFAPTGA